MGLEWIHTRFGGMALGLGNGIWKRVTLAGIEERTSGMGKGVLLRWNTGQELDC